METKLKGSTDFETVDGEGGGRMRHSPPGQGGDGGRHVSRTSNAGRQPRVDDVEDDMGG